MKIYTKLRVQFAGSIALAFLLTLGLTWAVFNHRSEREAFELIDRIFSDVRSGVREVVDAKLIHQAMVVRDRLPELEALPEWKDPVAAIPVLRKLAGELNVDEVCVVGPDGVLTHSARREDIGLDFHKLGGQAAEFLCLLSEKTELAQPLVRNSLNGQRRKYVGVWLPRGGFVQVGCLEHTLLRISQSVVTGLTHNLHVGGEGRVVITTKNGRVISDALDGCREGAQFEEPSRDCYWERREVEGFPTYVVIPKHAAAVRRNVLVGFFSALNGLALALVALFIAVIISRFVRHQMQVQQEQERQRQEKDLEMANTIQLSALPNVFPPFPDELSVDIYAQMATAKEVGGDFYDFYFTGPNHVCFLVADVSGKGIPAALFMMRAKALLKSAAQTGRPIAEVVNDANDALCEGNEANMFVTAWIGDLDLATGHVTYVNAGHNPPLVRAPDGTATYLRSRSGLVLGAMSGIKYRAQELQLQPGQSLYLYTDGVTEQPDVQNELFGEDRLQKIVSDGSLSQRTLLARVQQAVTSHGAEVEQADDCTQLEIRYRGQPQVASFVYPPTLEGLAQATEDLDAALGDIPKKEHMQLMVAADEIFANIVHYSGATDWSLRVEKAAYPAAVRLVFSDDGKPFDPLQIRDPDTTLSLEERQAGGLGILIVKKTMSPVTYARKNGRNILMMSKVYEV